LSRYVGRVEKRPAAKSVHRFRTYSRRVEVLVAELEPALTGNHKKMLKLLARLRKKAGRVRDLDVQIAALRSLKIPQEPGRKSQLMRTLVEERAEREKKLPKIFDKEVVTELHKRLKRAAKDLPGHSDADPVVLALRLFSDLEKDHAPITEKKLHQYRIVGKQARYLAELAGKDPEAQRVVDELKRMQDVIGDWHDWLKLTDRAKDLFGDLHESALVAALHNVTRAKFRQAVNTLTETRAALAGKKPVSLTKLGLRPAQDSSAPDSAVA